MASVSVGAVGGGGITSETTPSLRAPAAAASSGAVTSQATQKYFTAALASSGGSTDFLVKSPTPARAGGGGAVSVKLKNSVRPGTVGASAYLGEYGALTEIPYISSRKVSVERPLKVSSTIGGRKVAAVGRLARRRWTIGVQSMPSDHLGALMEKLEAGAGPFLWIDPHMTVSNMLTPAQANLEPQAVRVGAAWNGSAPSGRLDTDDGPSWSSYRLAPMDQIDIYPIPVREHFTITASIYAAATDLSPLTGSFQLGWLDSAGKILSWTQPKTIPRSTRARRVSITETAPASAEAARIAVLAPVDSALLLARPALTWTPMMLEWCAGQGVGSVVCAGFDAESVATFSGPLMPRTSNVSFTVEEVG